MKKANCKLLATVLALVIAGSTMLAGCAGSPETPASSANPTTSDQAAAGQDTASGEPELSWQKDTTPFEFDLYFFASWGNFYPWRGSLVEQYITEATGVTPNIIIPTGNEKEYLNVMIASNDLPDAMILEWNSPDTKKLIQSGNILSVDDMSAQYAPELMDMIPDEIKTYHKQDDGKLYYLPSFFTSKEEYDNATEKHGARPLFIQKGIYEGLGSPSVDTPEKLLQMLKDIKVKYPDVKPFGIEPPIDVNQWGMMGSYTLQYFSGIFAPETYAKENWYVENDKIKLLCQNPNFVEGVKFLNSIYREGLISVDSLTMKHENFEAETDSAQYAVQGTFPIDVWKKHNPKIMALTNDESKTFIPLEYFKAPGKEPQFFGGRGAGWVASMVTSKAKNPERIIRYFEYCWSDEGQITNLFGREGVTFDMVDGMPHYKPEILQEMETDAATFGEKYGFEARALMWRSKWAGWQKLALAPQEYTDYVKSVRDYGVDVWDFGLDGLEPDPASPEGVSFAKIKNIWNKYLAQMVLAKDDAEFNSAYEAGMKEINEAGLENLTNYMTQKHIEDIAKKQGK